MTINVKIRRQSVVADTIIGTAEFAGVIAGEYCKLAKRTAKTIWNLKK